MSTSDRPTGGLTVGAIGGYISAAGYLLFFLMLFMPLADIVSAIAETGRLGRIDDAVQATFADKEFWLYVIPLLLGIGQILSFIGYLSYAQVRSGLVITTGVFNLLFGLGSLFLFLVLLLKMISMVELALGVFGGTFLLAQLFGNIGLWGGNGMSKGAAALTLIAGLAVVFMVLPFLIQSKDLAITVLKMATIFGIAAFAFPAVANGLAGTAMLTDKGAEG